MGEEKKEEEQWEGGKGLGEMSELIEAKWGGRMM